MFDRRLVTDVALAALIAFPAALPASQSVRSALVQSAAAPAAVQLSSVGQHESRWSVADRS